MNKTASIGEGILAIAAIFGLIGGGVAFVAWDYGFIGAAFIAAIVATIVAIVLLVGWRPAKSGDVNSAAVAHRAGHAPTVPATGVAQPKPAPAPVAPSAKPAAAAAAPVAVPADPKPAPEPAPQAATVDKGADSDDTVEGTKPATLSAARDGGPDDLKQIKGVGPKMESMLHGMGFYHFDQIAAWTGQEVAWVDANLEGFKGRVSRDDWVAQAQTLAAGGTTEFSKKVKKGDVY